MTNLLNIFNEEQMAKLKNNNIDDFRPGDTVSVDFEVYDRGVYIRNQNFEGVCIAKKNRGFHSSFILRKISFNEGIERSFEFYSPYLKSAKVKRYGVVRRAKLYYLRKLKGKAARIPERKVMKK